MSSRFTALRRAAAQTRPWNSTSITTRSVLEASRRWQSTSASDKAIPRTRRIGYGTLAITGLGALSSSAYFYFQPPAQTRDVNDTKRMYERQTPLTELIRTYTVYSMCSIPWLVDHSPSILPVLLSVPGLKHVTEAIVRATFFSQFVGGESASDTFPVLTQLRAENKGAILNYSAEVHESEAAKSKDSTYKQHVEEIIRCIDAAADFEDQRQVESGTWSGRKTWVAVKLTALVPDAETFINFSKYLIKTRPQASRSVIFPGVPRPSDLDILKSDSIDLPETYPLTKEDILSLRELRDDLFRICKRAKERGVAITIDAEHSWYQPAIEAFQLALMREFNSLSSNDRRRLSSHLIVYGTFQAYLRRTPEQLEQSFRDAESWNFALGVKLVRGAYHQLETSSHAQANRRHSGGDSPSTFSLSISPDDLPPVWQTKAETDSCFNACARTLVARVAEDIRKERDFTTRYKKTSAVPKLGLLFGTHNPASCELVLDALVDEGIAVQTREVDENGQAVEVIRIGEDVAQRVAVGQLYGMCDALSTSLAQRVRISSYSSPGEPFVMKYIPYGPLPLVMSYLGRRAIENKSILEGGGAREERDAARREIWKRAKGWFGIV